MIADKCADLIQEALFNAMISEISVTPKPGLVDRGPLSAHRDMDYFTFVRSSGAIAPYFRHIALLPFQFPGKDLLSLFKEARKIGIEAEAAMLRATNGINTQKGIIFLGGFLALSLGILLAQETPVSEEAIRHIIIRLSAALQDDLAYSKPQTHGEILHQRHHTRGIRGEVEGGLPCVFELGLPTFQRALQRGTINQAGVEALLAIMGHCEDTTILWRHGPAVLREVQFIAQDYLLHGGVAADSDFRRLMALDIQFSRRGISPGGAADLLFFTVAVHSAISLLSTEPFYSQEKVV